MTNGEIDKITGLNKKSIFRIMAGVGIAILATIIMCWIGSYNIETKSNPKAQQGEIKSESLTVLNWDWNSYDTTFDGKRVRIRGDSIVGRVKNNSKKQFSYVQIDFNLYDEDGNHVGTAMGNTNNLEPNSIWEFRAMPFMSGTGTANVKSTKLKGVTAF